VIIAGNGTLEAMARAGIEEVIEVSVNGRQWVIVSRDDLTADSPQAKSLMVGDNRSQSLDYNEDVSLLGQALIAMGDDELIQAAGYEPYEVSELNAIEADLLALDENIPESTSAQAKKSIILRCLIATYDLSLFEEALILTGRRSRHEALAEICRTYIQGHVTLADKVLFEPMKVAPDGQGVYVVQDTEISGLCKIGATTRLKERLKRLFSGLPFRTEIIHVLIDDNPYDLESVLHKRFQSKRKHSEWFELDSHDINIIKNWDGNAKG